ncbi:MAG: gamma-glutamyltransferase family protein [Ideonella sp.]|nr:gamma-glutamyltransferase family protein [Ideonella sp.]
MQRWPALLPALLAAGLAGCGGDDEVTANACLQTSPSGVVYNPGTPGENGAPEIATGFASKAAVPSRSFMVVANNPLATKAGCDVLKKGGSAVDAAVAVQMVLNLVEPQSSGIGGGAFMLHYDAKAKTVMSYDGRETAPAAATENYLRWISATQQTTPLPNARASGRSIGTPGVLHMLDTAHKDAGKLSWKELFDPAIQIATDGFKISPRMAASIAGSATSLTRDPDAKAYFLNADGTGKAAGTLLKSPALAATFKAIADGGINAFYTGPIAQDIIDKIGDTTGGITPGLTTLADLAAYRAKKRDAVCANYRGYQVCGMGPPSSGGIAVAQTLGILSNFDLAPHKPTAMDINGGKPTVMGVHLVSEAQRLAYADRDKYVADTDFVPLPGGSPAKMLDATYLSVAAGKRPRSSMSPTLVFTQSGGQRGDFLMSTGSPGGSTIIQYVGKTLVGVLDWGMDAQQATSMVDFGAANSPSTNVGSEHPNVDITNSGANDTLITGLKALGHTVNTAQQSSGLSTIVVRTAPAGYRYYEGGADPRREGVVLGDVFKP